MAEAYVEIKTENVEAMLVRLETGLGDARKLMGEIGHFLAFSMLDRIEKGRDVEGIPFEPYSIPYAKLRAEEERPVHPVDLFFSGQMTSALTYEEAKDVVRLFFLDTPRRPYKGRKPSKATNAAIAYYNNEIREFFAISVKEQAEILELANTYFKIILEGK